MDLANAVAKGFLTGALGLIGLRKTSRALTRGHESAVTDISVDPSGTFLCSCDKEGNCKAWMVSYGYVVLEKSLGVDSSASCVLACRSLVDVSTPGSDLVVFAAGQNQMMKGVICCWEASRSSGMWKGQTTVKQLFCFQGEAGAITQLALMPGQRLAVASVDGLLWIADLRQRKAGNGSNDVILPSINFSSVTALLIVRQRFPETSKIVVGSETGRISIWNDDRLNPSPEQADSLFVNAGKEAVVEDTTRNRNFNYKFLSLGSVNTSSTKSVYPHGTTDSRRDAFAVASSRRRKRRASFRGRLTHEKLQQKNPPMCTYWAHGKRALQGGGISAFVVTRWIDEDKANLLFSASGDTTVKMWWLGKPELLATFRGHRAAVTKLVVLRSDVNGQAPELFSASNDTTIMQWSINAKEPEKCTCLKIFRGHDSIINDLMLVDIPTSVEAGGGEEQGSKETKAPLIGKDDDAEHTHYLITSSRDGTVRAWHLKRGDYVDEHAKSYRTIHRSTNSLTKLVPHETDRLDIDAGVESHDLRSSWAEEGSRRQDFADTNAIVACNSGRITYLDLFPSPQLKLTFRSATAYELCSPILDWATYMFQKTRLVWPTVSLCLALLGMVDESGKQKVLHREAVEDAIEKALSRKGLAFMLVEAGVVTEEYGFIIEHVALVWFALMVILLISCKVYRRLQKYHTHVMKAEAYIEEISTFTQAKARDLQPAHRKANLVQQSMDLVYIFLWGTVKVLTVPILTHIYSLIDCPILKDGRRHLSIDHDVLCWQGKHLYYAGISIFVALGYVLCVLPFTFVGSNIRVFSDSKGIEELRRNSAITACSIHLAFLTPIGINWSTNQLMEFIVKAILPAVAILQNQHHVLRCSMITAVLAVETMVAIVWPAYSDSRASFLYSSLKFSLLYVSMCTLYGGYHADRLEAAPGLMVAIIAGLVVIFVAVIVRIVTPDKYAAKCTCCDGNSKHPGSVEPESNNVV